MLREKTIGVVENVVHKGKHIDRSIPAEWCGSVCQGNAHLSLPGKCCLCPTLESLLCVQTFTSNSHMAFYCCDKKTLAKGKLRRKGLTTVPQ